MSSVRSNTEANETDSEPSGASAVDANREGDVEMGNMAQVYPVVVGSREVKPLPTTTDKYAARVLESSGVAVNPEFIAYLKKTLSDATDEKQQQAREQLISVFSEVLLPAVAEQEDSINRSTRSIFMTINIVFFVYTWADYFFWVSIGLEGDWLCFGRFPVMCVCVCVCVCACVYL